MTVLFAAVDFIVPGEINVAIFYVLSVVAAGWSRSRRLLWLMTAICIGLTYAGQTFGPPPSEGSAALWAFYVNRSFVTLGLLIIAAVVDLRMQSVKRLEEASAMQRRQNEMLRASEAQVRATFDQAAVGIALTDLRGRFFQVNERLCALTGYSRDELLARNFRDITHPDDVERNLQLNTALIAGAFPYFHLEKRYLRSDGSPYWVNVTSALVRRASGEPDYVIAVVEDISARKRAEAELRRINEELERRVEKEVGKRLEVEQSLRQAQKMEAIGQITGGVAHDFNNILTTVIGNLDRIADQSAADDPRRRFAENALRGAEQGARLTQHLLSFARRQRLEPEVIGLDRVLASMLALARQAVSETVELSLELGADLWSCRVDQAQLQSAILNLVINARDAMPKGGRVVIAAHNVPIGSDVADLAPGEYVRLAVKDNGSGMTPEVLARVFEPFFTTKEPGKGSGLGLSMVYGFAKQSGGTARIESVPGAGTTVQIYLPRSVVPAPAIEPAAPRPVPVLERPATILIAEDEEGVRHLAAESLEELGYRVLLASDGPEAMSLLERERVDLLLSDIIMPGGMSGLELADEGRRMRNDLPVLLTTGYAEVIDRAMARDARIELLRKPFRPRELGNKIYQMLSAAPQRRRA